MGLWAGHVRSRRQARIGGPAQVATAAPVKSERRPGAPGSLGRPGTGQAESAEKSAVAVQMDKRDSSSGAVEDM